MNPSTSRRHFLRLSATLSAGIGIAPAILRARSPNSKLNLAIIGAGGKGADNLKHFVGENIVALCDVDTRMLDKAATIHPKARTFQDYRKLFDGLKDGDYDAVVVSTPDHQHFPATLRALKAKKHVYCEKPLTHTIWEAREVKRLAAEAGVATQMGNHGNASEDLRVTTEWVQSGAIGNVREVHCWSNRPIWPQGISWPKQADAVPSHLDWDLWLGPAAERPYYKDCHPFKWRGFWDFGTGAFGDMGCHIMNWPFTALGLGIPETAECLESVAATADSPPTKSRIRLTFTVNGKPLALTWHDGGFLPPAEAFGGEIPLTGGNRSTTKNGCLIVGDKGVLFDDYDGGPANTPTLLPAARAAEAKAPEKSLPRSPGHFQEFLIAAKGGPKAGSDFVEKACGLTEMVLLGQLAARLGPGKKIEWDAEKGLAKNARETDGFVNKVYRPGWIS